MNPFRSNFVPEGDRADVEKHRIHEEEETKRRAVSEREATLREKEKTVQKSRDNDGYWTVRVILVLAFVVAVIATAVDFYYYLDKRYPSPQPTPSSTADSGVTK